MAKIERYRYWLPPRFPGGKERLSTWHMSDEEAKRHGALRPEPTSLQVHQVEDDPGPRPGFQAGWRTGPASEP